ncbi:hypothetical protein, partial [Escherichia coli]|uniref:hypothetical protein n=1 Tax=Escherichia coli TaxID=562 RepID=UPI001F4B07F7
MTNQISRINTHGTAREAHPVHRARILPVVLPPFLQLGGQRCVPAVLRRSNLTTNNDPLAWRQRQI